MPHLFEFMDLDWLPSSLRHTLREILECGNNKPFRPYYDWVADELLRLAEEQGFTTLVELGAGPAPITQALAKNPRSEGLRLVPCDINPDRPAYESLEKRYNGKVFPRYEPIDFSRPHQWEPGTLLYLSGTFHHIPVEARAAVLKSLSESADGVLVVEPLRKTIGSILFVLPSIVPALVLPVWQIARPGRFRRFLYCWLVPVAPFMFWWEGFVSCLRMWSDAEWRSHLQTVVGAEQEFRVEHSAFCQLVTWKRPQVLSAV